jgi:hypothetical protein
MITSRKINGNEQVWQYLGASQQSLDLWESGITSVLVFELANALVVINHIARKAHGMRCEFCHPKTSRTRDVTSRLRHEHVDHTLCLCCRCVIRFDTVSMDDYETHVHIPMDQ